MFLLEVHFKILNPNGDIDWTKPTKFWERRFNTLSQANIKFRRMLPHLIKHSNNTKPFCNLRGFLIKDPNTPNEKIIDSWDWESLECRDEWTRSEACNKWLEEFCLTPSSTIVKRIVEAKPLLTDLLVFLEFCSSKSDARRQIKGSAVRLNETKITEVDRVLMLNDFINNEVLLSLGKRNKHKFKLIAG
jgi:hypothetical protein